MPPLKEPAERFRSSIIKMLNLFVLKDGWLSIAMNENASKMFCVWVWHAVSHFRWGLADVISPEKLAVKRYLPNDEESPASLEWWLNRELKKKVRQKFRGLK